MECRSVTFWAILSSVDLWSYVYGPRETAELLYRLADEMATRPEDIG